MTVDQVYAYDVPDVSCGHCRTVIEREVRDVPGVDHVEVDLAAKRVVVRGTASPRAVRAAIERAGYEVVA